MTAARPLDWITEIEASLAELDAKPQFGLPGTLNWKEFEQEIQKLLGYKDLKLVHQAKGWLASNELFAGLGGKLLPLTLEWAPLKAPAFFVTDRQNLKDLMSLVFESEEATNFFYDPSYVTGFYNYFAAELLRLMEKQSFSSPLTPRLGPNPEDIREIIGDMSCFVIDVSLEAAGKTLWGRILLSENFRKDWKNYFAHLGPPALSEDVKQKINALVSLEVAHARLSFEEWEKAKEGDFVILDHCSYDPVERKGGVVLTLNQKPVFRGRLKDGSIKITNYPIYEEVSDAMDDTAYGKGYGSEDEDDLYGDLGEDEDSEFDEDEDIFAGLEPRKEAPKIQEEKKPVSLEKPEEGPSISPAELPVRLTVEIGRIKMSVGDLMNLAPGNLLELNVTPEQGVDLVINGKKVGRGELIRIGDVLGVRILSL
jgi:flagellar motor switch protein FliN/FliY